MLSEETEAPFNVSEEVEALCMVSEYTKAAFIETFSDSFSVAAEDAKGGFIESFSVPGSAKGVRFRSTESLSERCSSSFI